MGIGSAVIGALRVQLGLDSAQFTAGLKVAKGDLSAFGKFAGGALLGVTGIAIGLASAFGLAAKASINHADAMSKMAQKAGVSTEALSRLAYAANFSEVSLEDVTGSLGKLSKTMAEASQNTKGTAASAFAALDINVKEANGSLRDANDVFSDIADRFSRIPDGATKTALSMALLGKSGAQLIPVLNEGADGLKRYADESDRTGNTISTKFGNDANRFNDSLTHIQGSIGGVINKIVGSDGFLDGLGRVSDTLSDPKFAQAAGNIAQAIVDSIAGAMPLLENFANNISAIHDMFVDFQRMSDKGQQNAITDLKNQVTTIENRITENQQRLDAGGAGTLFGINNAALKAQIDKDIAAVQPLIDKIAELQRVRANAGHGVSDSVGSGPGAFSTLQNMVSPPKINLPGFTDGLKSAQEAIDPFEARVNELADALTATVDPFSQMKMDLTDLQTMFDHGRISASQFGDAIVKSTAGGIAGIADLAGGLSGALSDMFKENKAIAVANAIVNGIGSVAKTFETYGATPWGFAAAGIAAATAAANVASILSTSENSTSAASASAGSASSASAAPAAASNPAIHLTLTGSHYSQRDIENLVDQINEHLGLGGKGFVTS